MVPFSLVNYVFDHTAFCLVVVIIALLYYYSTSTYDTWLKINVPYVSPVPLFGNMFKMIMRLEHQTDTYERIYRTFPDAKICGYYVMRTPFLMIRDPELIHTMMINAFWHFSDHGLNADPAINLMGRSLFFVNGQKWKTMRQKINPGFTPGKLKGSCDQMNECSDQMMKCIDEVSTKQSDGFEVKKIIENMATQVIGMCAFGLKLDSVADEDSDFRKHVRKLILPGKRALFAQLLSLMFPKVVKIFKLRSISLSATNFFHSMFNDIIAYRTENNLVRNDLAQTLLDARNELVLNSDVKYNDEGNENTFIRIIMYNINKKHIQYLLVYATIQFNRYKL